MMSSTRSLSERFVLPMLVAVTLAVSPLSARAAGGMAASGVEAQARSKFAEGNIAYDLGEFQKALDAYSEAYRLKPLPGFLFNIAQCHRQMGRPERAAFFYRRYLAVSKKAPPNAALVQELIAEMDSEVRKEQEQHLKREEKARDQARASALRAQSEAAAARRVQQQGGGKRSLAPRAKTPVKAESEVKSDKGLMGQKWWVWAGAGAVALIAGGVIYTATAPQPRPTSLGTIP